MPEGWPRLCTPYPHLRSLSYCPSCHSLLKSTKVSKQQLDRSCIVSHSSTGCLPSSVTASDCTSKACSSRLLLLISVLPDCWRVSGYVMVLWTAPPNTGSFYLQHSCSLVQTTLSRRLIAEGTYLLQGLQHSCLQLWSSEYLHVLLTCRCVDHVR